MYKLVIETLLRQIFWPSCYNVRKDQHFLYWKDLRTYIIFERTFINCQYIESHVSAFNGIFRFLAQSKGHVNVTQSSIVNLSLMLTDRANITIAIM